MHALMLAGLMCLSATPVHKAVTPAPDKTHPCANIASFRSWAMAHAVPHEKNALMRWEPPQPVRSSEQAVVAKLATMYMDLCGAEEIRTLAMALVNFSTVNSATTGKETAAFTAAGDFVRRWAREADLNYTATDDGSVWEVSTGFGDPHQVWLTHVDVVPGGDGWHSPAFSATFANGRIFGRGIEDGKGALAAALVTLRTVAALGLQPRGTLAVAVGTDAERGLDGMRGYAKNHANALAAIALDTVFPLAVAEPGVGFWKLSAPLMGAAQKPLRPVAVAASSGNLSHPGSGAGQAQVTLRPGPNQTLSLLAQQAQQVAARVLRAAHAADPTLRVEVIEVKGQTLEIQVHGRPVYDPAQDSTSNVVWVLGQIARQLDVAPNGIGALLAVIDGFFAGKQSPLGGVFMVPTALGVVDDSCELQLYLRVPTGTDETTFRETLALALKRMQAINPYLQEVSPATLGQPWVSRASTDVTNTLTKVYKAHTGLAPRLVTMPNDSYARLFEQGIGFGPMMPPPQPRTAHGPNESVALSDLKVFGDMLMHVMLSLEFGYE